MTNNKTDNKLVKLIEESGLEPVQAKSLLDSFGDFFLNAHKLVTKAKAIKVTSIDQVEEMKEAREIRLELARLRVKADKTRITLKADYLRGGNAVQAIFNDIKEIVKPEEDRLIEQEKFIERIEEEKKNKIEAERITELSKYTEEVEVYTLHPNDMSTDSFDKLLETSKVAFNAKKVAEEKLEQERIEKEKAEKLEQERIRKENAKLKTEAEARELKIKQEKEESDKKAKEKELESKREREEADEKLRIQQEKADKAENELKEKKEAEAEAEAKKQREAEDKIKAEKNAIYKKWKTDNNFDPITMKVERSGDEFIMWKKISLIKL